MNFLLYLFKSIPKILFEPIAVGTLIWFIFAIFFFRKRNKPLFWMVFASVVFMLSWRLGFLMRSSRYAAFLIYPAVIFTACFFLKVQIFLQWLLKKLKCKKTLRKILSKTFTLSLFAALVVSCIGKTLHRNPYGNFLYDITQAYLKHSGGKGFIHTQGVMRVSWYIGRDFKKVEKLYLPQKNAILPYVRKTVARVQNIPGDHYFFYYLKKGEPAPGPETMKEELAGGEWTILDRRWVSPRKNNEFILARYKPDSAYMEEWSGKIPDLPKNNLIKNGGFETRLSGEKLKALLNHYKKLGFHSYADPNIALPADWIFRLDSDPNNPPDLHLTTQNVIAGRYSLSADAQNPKKPFSLLCYPIKKRDSNYLFSFFIRNDSLSDSEISFQIIAWKRDTKRDHAVKRAILRLSPGKIYRIYGTIKKDEIPSTAADFYIFFYAKGKYTFDQFSIIEDPLKK